MPKLCPPVLPKNPTAEDVAAYKSAWRVYDAAQLASGEATTEEIQRRNSMIPREVMARAQISFKSAVCPDVERMLRRSRDSAKQKG